MSGKKKSGRFGEDEKAPQPEGGAEETQEDPEEETEEEEDGVWDMYNISLPPLSEQPVRLR